MSSVFPQGLTGLSDSRHSGIVGSASKIVGVDFRSTPGVYKVHQKMTNHSVSSVTEFCKHAVSVSDGSKLWFSSESGNIWREVSGVYTLVHTTTPGVPQYSEVFETLDLSADDTLLLTDDTALTNDCQKFAQTMRFTADTDIDSVKLYLAEVGINGGYSIKVSIQASDEGSPSGTELASKTNIVGAGDIGTTSSLYTLTFDDTVTLTADVLYWVVFEITNYASIGTGEAVSVSVSENGEDTESMKVHNGTAWTTTYDGGSTVDLNLRFALYVAEEDVALNTLEYASTEDLLLRETHFADNGVDRIGQSVVFTADTPVDTVVFDLYESGALNGSYSLRASIQGDDNATPDGIELTSGVLVIASGDIGTSTEDISITLDDTVTLEAGKTYWVVLQYDDVTAPDFTTSLSFLVMGGSTAGYTGGMVLGYRGLLTEAASSLDLESGSSQYASITDAAQTGLDITGDITVEAWIKPESNPGAGTSRVIASKYETTSNEVSWCLRLAEDGTDDLKFDVSADGTNITTASVGLINNLPTAVWTHIAVSYDASAGEATFYINGVQFDVPQTGLATSIYNGTAPFYIGARFVASAVNSPFDGKIMDVRVWNDIRTPTEIYENKKDYLVGNEAGLVGNWRLNGDYTDLTSNNNDLTATGSPVFSAPAVGARWSLTTANNSSLTGIDMKLKLSKMDYATGDFGEAKCLGAEEHDGYVYWATEKLLNRIDVDRIGTAQEWTDNAVVGFGQFAIGHNTYHPMVKQNLQLFVGDAQIVAKVSDEGSFVSTTDFDVAEPEVIQTLHSFDIDVLVGTRIGNKARVLRWDTEAESWSAEDSVDEAGVNAFIPDDNYVYVQAGDYGRLYFYNGEKMEPYKRIPGDWSPTKRAKVNQRSVGYLLGVPVFGLSNVTGNPTEQGIYGFGSYDKNYTKALSLDFPASTQDFSSMEFGALIVDGADMYVSVDDGTNTWIDKLDYTAKYSAAYIETMQLTAPSDRSALKTATEFVTDYVSLPTDTNVTTSYKKVYEGSWSSPLVTKNDTELSQIVAAQTIPKVASLQLRYDFVVEGNTAPEVENFAYSWPGENTGR